MLQEKICGLRGAPQPAQELDRISSSPRSSLEGLFGAEFASEDVDQMLGLGLHASRSLSHRVAALRVVDSSYEFRGSEDEVDRLGKLSLGYVDLNGCWKL